MKKQTTFLVVYLMILILFAGCEKNGSPTQPSDTSSGATTYSDDLKKPEQNPAISNTQIDSTTLTFTVTNGVAPVKTGDILLGTNGEGYLRRVISTAVSGNTFTATTENASMEEAIKEGHFDSTFVLQPLPDDLGKAIDYKEAVSIDGRRGQLVIKSGKPLLKSTAVTGEWTKTFPNFSYSITDNKNYLFEITTDALVVSINNGFTIQVDYTLIDGLKKLAIKNSRSLSIEFVNAELVLNGGIVGEKTKSYNLIPKINFGAFPIFGIPFIASLDIEFGIEYQLTASGGIAANNPIKITLSEEPSFTYLKGSGITTSYNPGASVSGNLTFKATSGFKGELIAFIKPELELKAVGQAGPTFFVKAFEYNTVTFPPLDLELGFGVAGGIGAEIELFSKKVFDQEFTFAEKRWSCSKKTYLNTAPNSPVLTSPANNTTNIPLSTTLSWTCIDPNDDALTYDIYFGISNPPSTKVASNQTLTTLTRNGLSNGTNYYWSVTATDEYGASTSSSVSKFTTISAPNSSPNTPSSPSPSTGATGISTSPTLSWNCSDPDAGDILTYDVYVGTNNPPAIKISTDQSAKNISRSSLVEGTQYFWRIIAKDNHSNSTIGPIWNFTTAAGSGTAPTVTTTSITGITATSATSGGNVTSQGTAPVTARGVCWSTSQNPTIADSKTSDGSGTGSFTSSITSLTPLTPYYIRAYATNSAGTGYGSQGSFTTTSGSVTPSNDPIAYYPFNGNANDESGNGQNGNNHGATLIADRFGNSGKAYSFNGSSNYIDIGNLGGINDVSYSIWMKGHPEGGIGAPFGTYSQSNAVLYVRYDGNNYPGIPAQTVNKMEYIISTKTANTRSGYGDHAIIDSTLWHHFVFTRTDNTVSMYIDGEPITVIQTNSQGTAAGAINSGLNMYIGANSGTDAPYAYTYFLGSLDDIRIYNRVLSQSEVYTLYHENGWNPGNGTITPEMVPVSGGTFTAGSTQTTISDFKIDKYEVTYELWTEVRNWGLNNGYTDLPTGQNGSNPFGNNNPVIHVNWYDVVKWCNARSEKDGLTPVYYTNNTQSTIYKIGQTAINNDAVKWNANGYRLPTECEWEFVARGGDQTHGYNYSGSNTLDDVAWYTSNSGTKTHTVGQKNANEFGIYDMSGNVTEWCWDWYSSTYPSDSIDPKGPSTTKTYRLMRGGSFSDVATNCKVDLRYTQGDPSLRTYISLGFRCAQK